MFTHKIYESSEDADDVGSWGDNLSMTELILDHLYDVTMVFNILKDRISSGTAKLEELEGESVCCVCNEQASGFLLYEHFVDLDPKKWHDCDVCICQACLAYEGVPSS